MENDEETNAELETENKVTLICEKQTVFRLSIFRWKILLEPYQYISNLQSKQIRPKLFQVIKHQSNIFKQIYHISSSMVRFRPSIIG